MTVCDGVHVLRCDCGTTIQRFPDLDAHVSKCPRIKANRIAIAKFNANSDSDASGNDEPPSEPCRVDLCTSTTDDKSVVVPDIREFFMDVHDEDQQMQSPPGCFYEYLFYEIFFADTSFPEKEDGNL